MPARDLQRLQIRSPYHSLSNLAWQVRQARERRCEPSCDGLARGASSSGAWARSAGSLSSKGIRSVAREKGGDYAPFPTLDAGKLRAPVESTDWRAKSATSPSQRAAADPRGVAWSEPARARGEEAAIDGKHGPRTKSDPD